MRRLHLRSFASLSIVAMLAALSLAGCQVRGEVTGQFSCVEDLRCPEGFTCVDGACVQKIDVEPEQVCGTTDQLSTSFDGAMLPWWAEQYVENGGTVAVTGGEVVMTVPANTASSRAQIGSYAHYDLRGRAFVLEVPQVGGRTTEVELEDPSGAEVYFGMHEGNMFLYAKGRVVKERPYSAVMDRWWRARADGQKLILETSPDGASWTELASDVAPIDFGWVQVEMSLQGAANVPAGTARWSTITPNVDPTIKWCTMASWTESITDNTLAPHSGTYGQDCTVVESGGALKISVQRKPEYCVVYSNRPVDARDSEMTIEVTPAPEPGWTRIALSDRGDKNIVSMYSDAELHFYVEANNNELLNSTTVLKPSYRFWRIALAGPQVRFEASSDGQNWESLASANAPMLDATALVMERTVYTDNSGNNNLPSTATFGALIR
jgi:hypothetical protein